MAYNFTDLNAKITHYLKPWAKLTANFYCGNDRFKMDMHFLNKSNDSNPDGEDLLGIKLSWGNILASLNWYLEFSDKIDFRIVNFYSRSNSKVNGITKYQYYEEGLESHFEQSNPKNYMEPYDPEKVKIANQLHTKLRNAKLSVDELEDIQKEIQEKLL